MSRPHQREWLSWSCEKIVSFWLETWQRENRQSFNVSLVAKQPFHKESGTQEQFKGISQKKKNHQTFNVLFEAIWPFSQE